VLCADGWELNLCLCVPALFREGLDIGFNKVQMGDIKKASMQWCKSHFRDDMQCFWASMIEAPAVLIPSVVSMC
jgi:hypothetical protein